MRTPAWEDQDLVYQPSRYELDGTLRARAHGQETLLSWARPTPWFTIGSEPGPGAGLEKLWRWAGTRGDTHTGSGARNSSVHTVSSFGWGFRPR